MERNSPWGWGRRHVSIISMPRLPLGKDFLKSNRAGAVCNVTHLHTMNQTGINCSWALISHWKGNSSPLPHAPHLPIIHIYFSSALQILIWSYTWGRDCTSVMAGPGGRWIPMVAVCAAASALFLMETGCSPFPPSHLNVLLFALHRFVCPTPIPG